MDCKNVNPRQLILLNGTIFWDITPYSPLSINRHFGEIYRLHLQGRKNKLLSRWILAQLLFPALKMEAICSSETSVDTQQSTRRYIPEDGTFHNHRCANLKPYNSSYRYTKSVTIKTKASLCFLFCHLLTSPINYNFHYYLHHHLGISRINLSYQFL
jgi:hypothetical protein